MTLFFKRPKYYLVNISVNEVQVSEKKSFYKPIWDFFSFCSKFDPNAPRNAVLGKWRKPHAVSTPAAMNVWTALKITTVTRRVITVTATCTVTHLDHSLRLIFCLYESHFGLFFHLGGKKASHAFLLHEIVVRFHFILEFALLYQQTCNQYIVRMWK